MKQYIKKIILFCMVIFLIVSNVSFAIVLEDDNTALITKAEYDAIKNNIQSQLDSYSTKVDEKVDTAIASYLAGISLVKDPTEYWSHIQSISGNSVYWLNQVNTGSQDLTSQVNLSVTRELTELYGRPQAYGWYNPSGSYRWDATNKRVVTSGGTQYTPSNGIYWIRHFVNATTGGGTDIKYFDLIDFGGAYGGRTHGYGGSSTAHTWQIPLGTEWTGSFTANMQSELQTYYSAKNNSIDGSGTRWEAHKSLTNKNILRNYYTSYFPIFVFTVWDHIYYSNNTIKSAFEDGGRGWETEGAATAPLITNWGIVTNGNEKITKDSSNYTTSSNYLEVKSMVNKISDLVDYSVCMFYGNALNTQIYYSFDDAGPYRVGSNLDTIEAEEGEFYDLYHEPRGELLQTNKIAKYTLSYQKYNVSWTKDYLNDFYNEYVSQAVGEDVYVGQGVKLCKSNESSERNYNIKIKFKSNPNVGNVEYKIINKKFNRDGTVPSNARVIKDGVASVGTEVEFIAKLDEKEEMWINLQSTTAGTAATIDTFSVKMSVE